MSCVVIRARSLPKGGFPVYLYDKADMEQEEERQPNDAADGDSEDDNTIRMEFD